LNLFADSSALAKRYLEEEGSSRLDEILAEASSLTVSVLCLPEIVSALCRRRRERAITPAQYSQAKAALTNDVASMTIIQITDEVATASIRLLEHHALRASDAVQIASALAWGADAFTSADVQQCAAARLAGLRVVKL